GGGGGVVVVDGDVVVVAVPDGVLAVGSACTLVAAPTPSVKARIAAAIQLACSRLIMSRRQR
ncbi:MAG: hypothetical protein WKF42_01775, partial [Solirubrobacteraceae bacterium]